MSLLSPCKSTHQEFDTEKWLAVSATSGTGPYSQHFQEFPDNSIQKQAEPAFIHYPGGRSFIQSAMIMRNVPRSVFYLVLSSLSEQSLKQYDITLKKWFRYCTFSRVDLYSPAIADVVRFMKQMYEQGARYSTLHSSRSALRILLGDAYVDNEQIRGLMAYLYHQRKYQQKRKASFDTSIVLNYLARSFPNEDLPLNTISQKLITLLYFVTKQKISILSKIKLSNISISSSNITIHIPDLKSHRGRKRQSPSMSIPFFDDRPEVCPARTLLSYIHRTKSIRRHSDYLFIATKRPYEPITTQGLRKWLKSVLGVGKPRSQKK